MSDGSDEYTCVSCRLVRTRAQINRAGPCPDCGGRRYILTEDYEASNREVERLSREAMRRRREQQQ